MIEGLHEITLPEVVSYMPRTVGWLIVTVLLLALGTWVAFRWSRYRQANRYRSLALKRLTELECGFAVAQQRAGALITVPRLVKRVALEAYPREDVASLSEKSWLEFLDESYGGTGFTDGPGRLLPVLSYVSPTSFQNIRDKEISELMELVKRWVKKHRRRSEL
jgi:hypothetical protein